MDAYSLRRNNLHLKTKNFNLKKKNQLFSIIYWERIYSQRKCVVKMRILVHVCQIKTMTSIARFTFIELF